MVRIDHNLQEVLSPLMKKFGRHLRAERADGIDQMVAAVCESLQVDHEMARHLLDSLVSCGLICFESEAPRRPEEQIPVSPGDTGELFPDAPAATGVWRIGPCV